MGEKNLIQNELTYAYTDGPVLKMTDSTRPEYSPIFFKLYL